MGESLFDRGGGCPSLLEAAVVGDLPAAEAALGRGEDIVSADAEGRTALFLAARQNHLAVVLALLERGVAVNQATTQGIPPLYMAARYGHLAVVRALLEHGAVVNQGTPDGLTPLYMAAQEGHLDVVDALLELGAAVNREWTYTGSTPLITAAAFGHLAVVETLMQRGADIDALTRYGRTAIGVAFGAGDVAARLRAVLAARTDAREGRSDVFRAALEAGTLPAPFAQWVPLLPVFARAELAAWVSGGLMANQSFVFFLLGARNRPLPLSAEEGLGLSRSRMNPEGCFLRRLNAHGPHFARQFNEIIASFVGVPTGCALRLLRLLRETGRDGAAVNQTATYGMTPLYTAARHGHLSVAKALLERGALVNQATTYGSTPLCVAARFGHLVVVEALLEAGSAISRIGESAVAVRLTAVLAARTDAREGRAHVFRAAIEAGSLPAPLVQWVQLLPIAARAELAAWVLGALAAHTSLVVFLFGARYRPLPAAEEGPTPPHARMNPEGCVLRRLNAHGPHFARQFNEIIASFVGVLKGRALRLLGETGRALLVYDGGGGGGGQGGGGGGGGGGGRGGGGDPDGRGGVGEYG